jgi:hypothetical protein
MDLRGNAVTLESFNFTGDPLQLRDQTKLKRLCC